MFQHRGLWITIFNSQLPSHLSWTAMFTISFLQDQRIRKPARYQNKTTSSRLECHLHAPIPWSSPYWKFRNAGLFFNRGLWTIIFNSQLPSHFWQQCLQLLFQGSRGLERTVDRFSVLDIWFWPGLISHHVVRSNQRLAQSSIFCMPPPCSHPVKQYL